MIGVPRIVASRSLDSLYKLAIYQINGIGVYPVLGGLEYILVASV